MDNSIKKRSNLFKPVSTVIVVCVVAAALIGLGLLFEIIESSDTLVNVLLSLLTLFIAGLLLLNSINAVSMGSKLGIFAAVMLLISAVLFLVLIWGGDFVKDMGDWFTYAIVIVSMTSVLLDVIVGHYVALKNSLIVVQVLMYLALAYVETAIALAILGNGALIALWQVFVTAIIVTLTLYIVLKVKEKNRAQSNIVENKLSDGEEYVTITKTEYENLKAEIERLKASAKDDNIVVPPAGTGNLV